MHKALLLHSALSSKVALLQIRVNVNDMKVLSVRVDNSEKVFFVLYNWFSLVFMTILIVTGLYTSKCNGCPDDIVIKNSLLFCII